MGLLKRTSLALPRFFLHSMAAAAPKQKAAPKPGVTLKDVAAEDFVRAYAAHLKKAGRLQIPKWADYCKTGTHKELAPIDPDWMYVRAASIARKIYLRGGIGIGGLMKVYGGPKDFGTRPSHFNTGSGSRLWRRTRTVAARSARTVSATSIASPARLS